MFISKTVLNKEALSMIGRSIFETSRTHDNDLVALQYMVDDSIDPYDAIRENEFTSLMSYTFCWAVRPEMYYKYVHLNVSSLIRRVVNDDNQVAYVCFFTANVKQWSKYCFDETIPKEARLEIRDVLSKDGYSLLFKEVNLLEKK